MASITESDSHYQDLEQMPLYDLLSNINREDKSVPLAVEKAIPQIEAFVAAAVKNMREGGRLFYIGAGTSGRLGIVDASECPPTFGVPQGMVIGLIAGGDSAIRKAVEFAEDSWDQAWKDLSAYDIGKKDLLVGIAASGRTPYVIGGIKEAKQRGILTGCVACNPDSELAQVVDFPIEAIVGPEFVTGSTRMKAGTAQKLVLNMITTSAMIQLGHVKGNKMVDMQLSNLKLVDRGVKMVMQQVDLPYEQAKRLLETHGSVRLAVEWWKKKNQ